MSIASVIRSVVPPGARASLRRSRVVNRFLAWRYGGEQTRPHPKAPFAFTFDGYRNIGWAMGGLAECETHELDFAGDLVRRRNARTVWDVGANVGLWTLYLASLNPPVQTVVCFEPDPDNLHYLRMNRDRNALARRIVLRDVALSSQSGTATFFSDGVTGKTGSLEAGSDFIGDYYGAARTPINVVLSTIDAEIAGGTPAPDFLKIDVEGHELDLLHGARHTLAQHHPAMVLEVSRHADEVTRLLRDLGYRLFDAGTGNPTDQATFATAAVYEP